MSKKIIGSVMMGALALSLITPAVPAAPVDAAGKVTYKVKGTTLTISGKGEMPKSMVFGKKSKTKNIKKVVIKKGVTTISKNAFKNCKKLKKVQLPSTLKKISGYAFYNTALTNVTIPNSVKYIGNYSFYKCKKLKKVSTPADLYAYNRVDEKGVINDTPLEQLTFTSAIKSLNDISWNQFDTRAYVVNKNDKNFSSYKGAIYNKKGDTLMYIALYAKQAEVKPSCESILTSAFTNDLGDDNYVPVKELKEFTIPAGVKNIVKDGEPLPAGIQYSVLSKDLTKEGVAVLLGTIGEKEAMRQMPERISLAGDYVVIDKTYLAEFADKTDAKKKAEEETLEIPEGVETIPDEMFRNFNMKEVKLPSTIRTIGANAFYNCKKLMKINFPASLKEIGKDAFYWTEIGDCISKEWQAKKDTFYASFTEYEKKQKEEQAKEQVKLLSVKLDEEREKQVELQEKISQNRLEVSSFQQKNNYVAENIHRIEESLHDLETEYNKLMQEQKNSDDTVSEMEQAIAGYEEKNKQLQEEIVRLTKEIEEESKQKEEMMASQKDIFEKRDALMNHMSELDKESFRLESRKQNIEEKMEAKVNHMWNEYELTYRSAKEIDIDHSISYTRMKANVTDTKNKIRGLGDVNVNAIEDFKSVSERYTLLKTQHDDLIESEDALKKIIADLDEEMRKQFTEKFADIQKQFDKVFRELFGGGKGTLELVEEEDVLEAGITINAQPPGKKLGNMMQLSGGEKALTAIALLFAIQNLKPSPFCLLDEIEAALDDSNVKRYAKYLHKLTKNTQFIVITHRKGTMEAADVLYGITMQEKGVSTLVSVKLIEEQLDN